MIRDSGASAMIDTRLIDQELREARKIRLRAQAAGRYLDALVRHMNRTRQPWQQIVSIDPQVAFLPN
jgi:hypothetical protein